MFTLNCNGKLLIIDKPLVMGIINVSTDSFYKQSSVKSDEEILNKTEQMISEGTAILDIGGQSTRPGSKRISIDAELDLTINAIEVIRKRFPEIIISADTYHSVVAQKAVEAGASIINDISGGNMDKQMLATVGKLHVPFVCMHIKGTPETMQREPIYEDVTKEILDFFIKKIYDCKIAGITDVIVDPGFGFGKTIIHNFILLKNLEVFKMLEKPFMAGISRKSTIYKTLKITVEEALNGTTVLHTLALQNGANILRVHDVKEAMEAITLFQKYKEA